LKGRAIGISTNLTVSGAFQNEFSFKVSLLEDKMISIGEKDSD